MGCDKFGAGQETAVLGQDRQGAGARADTALLSSSIGHLGAGNTTSTGDYVQNGSGGLEFLISSQKNGWQLAGDAELRFMYSQGRRPCNERAYAMTGDRRLATGRSSSH